MGFPPEVSSKNVPHPLGRLFVLSHSARNLIILWCAAWQGSVLVDKGDRRGGHENRSRTNWRTNYGRQMHVRKTTGQISHPA
jgi:hypothetical protein